MSRGRPKKIPDEVDMTEQIVPKKNDRTPAFSKTQILQSIWFSHRRNILQKLLEDDQKYTFAAVDELLKKR
jgi:hypothetical protein